MDLDQQGGGLVEMITNTKNTMVTECKRDLPIFQNAFFISSR